MATPSAALQNLIDQKKAETQKGQPDRGPPSKTLPSSSNVKDAPVLTSTPQKIALEESSSKEGSSKIKWMGAREMEEYASRLDKANFNLKLDLFHCRQRVDSLQEELAQSQEELDHQLTNNEQLLAVQAKLVENIQLQEEQLRERDHIIEESVAYICEIEQKLAQYENEAFGKPHFAQGGATTSRKTNSYIPPSTTRPDSVASTASQTSSLETTSQAPTVQGGDLATWPSLSLLSESSFKTVYGTKRKEQARVRESAEEDQSAGLTPIFQVFAPSDVKRKQLAYRIGELNIQGSSSQQQIVDTSPNTPDLTSGLSNSTDSIDTAKDGQISRAVPQQLRHKLAIKDVLPVKPGGKTRNLHRDIEDNLLEADIESFSTHTIHDESHPASKMWSSLSSLRISSHSDEPLTKSSRSFNVTNLLFDDKDQFPAGLASRLDSFPTHSRQQGSSSEDASDVLPIEPLITTRHRPRTSPSTQNSGSPEQEQSTPTPQGRPVSRSGHKRSGTSSFIPATVESASPPVAQSTQTTRRWLNRGLFRRSVSYQDQQDIQLETSGGNNAPTAFIPRSNLRSNTNNDMMKRSLNVQRHSIATTRPESIATITPDGSYVYTRGPPQGLQRRGVKFVNDVLDERERPRTAMQPDLAIAKNIDVADGTDPNSTAEGKRRWNLTSRRANLKGISVMRPRALSLTRR